MATGVQAMWDAEAKAKAKPKKGGGGGGGLLDDIGGAVGDVVGKIGLGNVVRDFAGAPGGILNAAILGPAHGLLGNYQDITSGHHDPGNDWSLDTNAAKGFLYGLENTASIGSAPIAAGLGAVSGQDFSNQDVWGPLNTALQGNAPEPYHPQPFWNNPRGLAPGLVNDYMNVSIAGAAGGKLAAMGDVGALADASVKAEEAARAGGTVGAVKAATKAAERAAPIREALGPEGVTNLADRVAAREKVLNVTQTMKHPLREAFNRYVRPSLRGAEEAQIGKVGAEAAAQSAMERAMTKVTQRVAKGEAPPEAIPAERVAGEAAMKEAAKTGAAPAVAAARAAEIPLDVAARNAAETVRSASEWLRTHAEDHPEAAKYTQMLTEARKNTQDLVAAHGVEQAAQEAAGTAPLAPSEGVVAPTTQGQPFVAPEAVQTPLEKANAEFQRQADAEQAKRATEPIRPPSEGMTRLYHGVGDYYGQTTDAEHSYWSTAPETPSMYGEVNYVDVPTESLAGDGVLTNPGAADGEVHYAIPRTEGPLAGVEADMRPWDNAREVPNAEIGSSPPLSDAARAEMDTAKVNESTAGDVPQYRKLAHLAMNDLPQWSETLIDHLPKPVVDIMASMNRVVRWHDMNVLVREMSRMIDASRNLEYHSEAVRVMTQEIGRALVGQELPNGLPITKIMADEIVGAEVMARVTGTSLREMFPSMADSAIVQDAMSRAASHSQRLPPQMIRDLGLEDKIGEAARLVINGANKRNAVLASSRLGAKGLSEEDTAYIMSSKERKLADSIMREVKNIDKLRLQADREVARATKGAMRTSNTIQAAIASVGDLLHVARKNRESVIGLYETPLPTENPVVQRGLGQLADETINRGTGTFNLREGKTEIPEFQVGITSAITEDGRNTLLQVPIDDFKADPIGSLNQALGMHPIFQLPFVRLTTWTRDGVVHIDPAITEWPADLTRADATLRPLTRGSAWLVGVAFKQDMMVAFKENGEHFADVNTLYDASATDLASHFVGESLNPRSALSRYMNELHTDTVDAAQAHNLQKDEVYQQARAEGNLPLMEERANLAAQETLTHAQADSTMIFHMNQVYLNAKRDGLFNEDGSIQHKAIEDYFKQQHIEYSKSNSPATMARNAGGRALNQVAMRLNLEDNGTIQQVSDHIAPQFRESLRKFRASNKAIERYRGQEIMLGDGSRIDAADLLPQLEAATSGDTLVTYTSGMNRYLARPQVERTMENLTADVLRGTPAAERATAESILSGHTLDKWTAENSGVTADAWTGILSHWRNLASPETSRAVVLDPLMARAFDKNEWMTPADYSEVAAKIQHMADANGVTPHEVQASIMLVAKQRLTQGAIERVWNAGTAATESAKDPAFQFGSEADPLVQMFNKDDTVALDAYQGQAAEWNAKRAAGLDVSGEVARFTSDLSGKVKAAEESHYAEDLTGTAEKPVGVKTAFSRATRQPDYTPLVVYKNTMERRLAMNAEIGTVMDGLGQEVEGRILGHTIPATGTAPAIVRLFQGGDFGTLLHENFHVLRQMLKPEEINTLEDSMGYPRGTFMKRLDDPMYGGIRRAAEEKFVEQTMQYMMSGQHEHLGLAPIMEEIRTGMQDLWTSYSDTRDSTWTVTPGMKMVYDKIFDPQVDVAPITTTLEQAALEPGGIGRRLAPEGLTAEQAAARNRPLPGESVPQALLRQKKMDRLVMAARENEALAANKQRRVAALQQNLNAMAYTIRNHGTADTLAEIARSDAKINKWSDKLGTLMEHPTTRQVPPVWQPMWEAITSLHKEAEADPILAAALVGLPDTFKGVLDAAAEAGFKPEHIRDFSPGQVNHLIHDSLSLGSPGRRLGKEMTAGTRIRRVTGTPRTQSISALAAATVEVMGEHWTNRLVDFIDRYHAVDVPEGGIPKGWKSWDARRNLIVNGSEDLPNTGGTHVTEQPIPTKMIPAIVDNSLERMGRNYSHPLLTGLSKVTNPWRTFILTLSPRWYVHTTVGTMLLAATAGVKFGDFTAAFKAYTDERKGMFGDLGRLDKELGTTYGESTGRAEVGGPTLYHDSTSGGSSKTIMPNQYDLLGGRKGIVQDLKTGVGIRSRMARVKETMTHVHDSINQFSRSAVYHATIRTTGDAVLAAQEAARALVDYGDLSPFERSWVRAVIPFYSWSKGVIKTAARLGYDHPVVFGMVEQMANLNAEVQRDKYGTELPLGYDGVVDVFGHPINTAFANPFASGVRLLSPSGIADAMNPFLGILLKSEFGASGSAHPNKYRMDNYGRLVPDVPVTAGLGDLAGGVPLVDTALAATGAQTYAPAYGAAGSVSHFLGDPSMPPDLLSKIVTRTKQTSATLSGHKMKGSKRSKGKKVTTGLDKFFAKIKAGSAKSVSSKLK